MVGYNRLVELDEAGTLARQKRHRAELIDPAIERHRGRIVKLTGDGMIAEFGSVVDAVQCAVSVQKEMVAREEDVPEDLRIRYRVAVNLGDVIFDEDDVYGDGVNIAARLEALAEPGGVVVSGEAYDHLKAKVGVGYRALGEKQLKNIATPVRVYHVVPDGEASPLEPPPKLRRRVLAFVAVALLFASTGVGAWWWSRPDFEPADSSQFVYELPDKPSIAVLPFDNLSGDPANDWLGDALAENLISTLASSPDLFIIARNSSFAFRDGDKPVDEIAEALVTRN